MNNELELKGVCYVLVQIGVAHPITAERHSLRWYPERAMSLLDTVQYRPYVDSVVTENPWIIACYPSENVRVWDDLRGWVMPNIETYGASFDNIMSGLLGIRQTIPSTALDGGKAIRDLRDDLKASRPSI